MRVAPELWPVAKECRRVLASGREPSDRPDGERAPPGEFDPAGVGRGRDRQGPYQPGYYAQKGESRGVRAATRRRTRSERPAAMPSHSG